MSRSRLPLSIALSDNPNTRPLIDGEVAPEGIALTPTVVHPSEMFWRQLKFAEFDVSEMSMSSLVDLDVARANAMDRTAGLLDARVLSHPDPRPRGCGDREAGRPQG